MGVSNGDEDGGGVDGDGSGGTPPSRQGAGTEISVPRTRVDDGGVYGTFRGWRLMYLGFSLGGVYIGERATSGGLRAPHHPQAWLRVGPRLGMVRALRGPSSTPFRTSVSLRGK